MLKVANPFSYNNNFVPRGYLSLLLGYLHVYNLVIFKFLLWNNLTSFHQISQSAFCWLHIIKCLNGCESLNKVVTLPIYGKNT